MKLTKSHLKKMIKEEKSGAKMYHRHGLHKYAKDEERHAKGLSQLLKKTMRGK